MNPGPLHIRHVVRQYYPSIGGLEGAVANLAGALNRTPGVTSSVVTLDRRFGDAAALPAVDSRDGVPIVRLPFRGSSRYPLAPQVLGALAGADIVHVHGIDFFFDYLSMTRLIHRRPLVASTHGGFFHTGFAARAKRVWFQTITRTAALGYARIIGSSEQDAARFAQIAPRRTVAIENGVNIAKWHGAAAPDPVPVMIAIGRFAVNKQLPALIRLVGALGAPWRLIVAGQESDLSAADLMREATALGVADRVTIAAAPDDDAVRALIGQASLFVSASAYEGFGLSAVEGMSAGLAPVLNAIAPFQRLIARTGRGVAVDMADAAAAAAAIHDSFARLRADPIGERTANVAGSAGYGWDGVAAQFLAEYRAVLAGAGRG